MLSPRPAIILSFLAGVAACLAGTWLAGGFRTDSNTTSAAQLRDAEYLADHPEILEQVRLVIMDRRVKAGGAQRVELMGGRWKFLTHAAFSPTIGPDDAPNMLLEFTDYTCIPCRASAPSVRTAMAKRKDTRTIVLPLPVGGAMADYSARIAIAAYRQDPDKFAALHTRLMETPDGLTQDGIMKAVRALGFDAAQVERDSESEEVGAYLGQIRTFAEEMKISAVPAFVFGEGLALGGVDDAKLQALLAAGAKTAPTAR